MIILYIIKNFLLESHKSIINHKRTYIYKDDYYKSINIKYIVITLL